MSLTIFVTGSTGFLSSHLLRHLLANDYQVIALKRSFSNTARIDDISELPVDFLVKKPSKSVGIRVRPELSLKICTHVGA